MRRITLCADDFGMSSHICEAVLQLVRQRSLTATSCFVDAPHLASYIAPLLELADDVSIGLHLNLTEAFTSSTHSENRYASLHQWWWRCYVRGASAANVRREISRQFDRFEAQFSRAPEFVDGHQHVHQLPVIRGQLIEEIRVRYGRHIALRSTIARQPRGTKALIIQRLGAAAFKAMATRNALMTNTDFAGVYDFSSAVPYADRMLSWATSIADGGLIMCHPELPGAATLHHVARSAEHDFFASTAWSELLRQQNIELIPFRAAG